jgi:DNA-binding NarL/FixJ family response regulator
MFINVTVNVQADGIARFAPEGRRLGACTGRGFGTRVLIVDDHHGMRQAIRRAIVDHGKFKVCGEAQNGFEAIQKVQELKPNIVILDICMPVMDGLRAAHHMRRLAMDIKIIMVTIHNSQHVRDLAMHCGADAVITKTDLSASLLQTIQKFSV